MASCPITPQAIFPSQSRIIAIGDIHGDWNALIQSLLLAKVIKFNQAKNKYQWIGGKTMVIQVGDILDRACRADWCPNDIESHELRILKFLFDLNLQAEKKGGKVLLLLGNHELMNVMGDFRYVAPSGFREFGNAQNRKKVFQPGGTWAKHLACHTNSIVQVGSWIFSHAGMLPEISYKYSIPQINQIIRNFLLGNTDEDFLQKESDLMDFFWHRDYASHIPNRCSRLNQSLQKLGAKRMVVGHSPQNGGITNDCDQSLWRIDTGMSEAFGPRDEGSSYNPNRIQVLEIIDDGEEVNILG